MKHADQSATPSPPVRTIRFVASDDGGVLFDPTGDRFMKLNASGLEIWGLLRQGKSDFEVADVIAQKYSVEQSTVLVDVQELLTKARSLGFEPEQTVLLDPERGSKASGQTSFPWYAQSQDSARPASSWTSTFQGFLGLLIFDLLLALSSADSLFRVVRSRPTRKSKTKTNTTAVGQICTAVEKACVWYPRRSLCLQRSAVTTWMLRRCGVPARLVVGVRPLPFLAHSWVEVDGEVINDFPRVKSFYQPVAFY